jgi:1-acyl-sn-glycerol-3-phosphate acyltransferase
MNLLRSALFALFFYPGTVVAVLAGIVATAIDREVLVDATYRWARYHRWCARVFLGVRARVEGTLPTGAVLVAAKHQSMFETIDFLLLLDRPAVVLKRELADLPGWGAIARQYGVIPVDREGGAAALRRMLKAAQAAVAAGRPILIFPEGTRVRPGEQPSLQPGFAGLYKSLGIPVVPVALDSGRLWPRRSFVKRPGVVTILVGEPIPPGLPRKEAEARVHAAINALEEGR